MVGQVLYMKRPLLKYICKRCVHSIFLLFIISMLIFGLLKSMPSDPVQSYLGMQSSISVEEKQQMKEKLGLEDSLVVQYQNWITRFVSFDFGESYTLKREVKDVLPSYVWSSILLYGSALSLAMLLSIAIASRKQKRTPIVDLLCIVGNSMPVFLLALLLLLVVNTIIPSWDYMGMRSANYILSGYPTIWHKIIDILQHMVLPLLVLSSSLCCVFIPYLKNVFKNIYQENYMVLAKASGVSKRSYFYGHALPNAMVVILQLIGMYLPLAISGSVIIETMFAWPGMGRLLVEAIQNQDIYVASACLFLFAIVVVTTSLLVDIVCALLNPTWKEGLVS